MRITDSIYVLSGSYYGAVGDQSVLGDVYGIKAPGGFVLIDAGMAVTGPAMIRETMAYYHISDTSEERRPRFREPADDTFEQIIGSK